MTTETTDSPKSTPRGKGFRNVPAKTIASALTAFATLCMSLAAYYKPETSARKSYDVLARVLEDQSKQLQQNHDDLVALRGYVDGYVQSREQAHPITVTTATPPPGQPNATLPPPQSTIVVAPQGRSLPPPPVHAKPTQFSPPAYHDVTQTEDISLFKK